MTCSSFELIPAIDLKGGRCVRLQAGDASRLTEYGDDPVAMALHWQGQGACRLHLVDLDGAFSGGGVHLEIAAAVFRAVRIPVQFGGGLRTLEQVSHVLELGASRAIVGTAAIEQPELVEAAVRHFPGAIIVAIDARQGRAAVRGWVSQSPVAAIDVAKQAARAGVERIIYTDIARDGLLCGVNVEATEETARLSGLKVTASGGVAGVEDIRALWERRHSGIEGVILGRALYEKKLDLAALNRLLEGWNRNAGQENHPVPGRP
ncbi:MAG: 1-(5-phosphoribosyl)-5-[(5-phosphoribosylamino)methylideneamino]imidazole-4-carboxamide isomerase [Acidobacteria bacterium]|nr:1-(5-phosphoribosyl)-5-[(5-phosphoribosylamino)methylideneamino]imidazole-4-carboxamide isomerase [Acidobacteriota bacterium]